MSERDLTLLISGVIVASTLVVFVWQYVRSRHDDDDAGDAGGGASA